MISLFYFKLSQARKLFPLPVLISNSPFLLFASLSFTICFLFSLFSDSIKVFFRFRWQFLAVLSLPTTADTAVLSFHYHFGDHLFRTLNEERRHPSNVYAKACATVYGTSVALDMGTNIKYQRSGIR
uniref:Uncharacterized protein n=1 Tax=Trypanosoma congolense (strain IL3000) TaxID=1068625 RepID=G0URT5_TRYCI|nr:hypothetical protein, unlikely [Trypanosoma congolense IL3000]